MEKKMQTIPVENVEGEIVNEVAASSAKMEFRLINPTEDGFLKEIRWNKEELDTAVRKKIADYENVVYTEDNMKQAKADRAELNKLSAAIDERRKTVKKIINAPYETFEAEVKEILGLIQKPIGIIDKQVKDFEEQQKKEKKEKIRASYEEIIGDLASVLPFDKVFDSRYLNQTYKLATAQTDIKSKVEKVRTDLETIDSLESKYKLNAKDVYIKTLDLSKALAENKRLSDLEERLEAEKRRKAEEEAERARREEERRKEAEEKARIVEEQRKAQQEYIKRQQVSIPESSKNVPEFDENISKFDENVPKSDESIPESNEKIVAPPAGNQAVKDPFASPDDTKQCKASFTVYGTRAQIMKLKQYMIDNNIKFGKVEK